MKKIETNTHLSYEKIADVVIDRKRLCSETLGRYQGNIILHKSYTINMSSGYGEESEYYILSPEECQPRQILRPNRLYPPRNQGRCAW